MRTEERYTFDRFVLDVGERRLTDGDRAIPLAPKVYDLLVALVRRAGHLLTKRELLDAVWSDAIVEEGILSVHVSTLRKALNDTVHPARYIETVPRAGYRFTAAVAAGAALSRPNGIAEMRLVGLADALTDRSRARLYELCGAGRDYLHAASMADVPKAIDAFKAAIEIDPTYASAHAGLALAHCAEAAMRLAPPADAYRRAKTAALKALAMSETSADAQAALGTVLLFGEWDWAGAERSLRRALEIDPSHEQAFLVYGRLLDACGRPEEALSIKLRALEANPRSPLVHVQIALAYWNRRDYDAAIEWAQKALVIDARHGLAREFLVGAYLQKGDHDRAMSESIAHAESFGTPRAALQPLIDAYAAGGRAAVVRVGLEHARNATAPALHLAILSTETGDLDAAFAYLELAIDARDPSLVDLAVGPQWEPLRSDRRFRRCLDRIGLP